MSRHLTFLMILSTFVNLVYPGLLEGTTIDVPQVQPASYNFNGSMDQVQFYGCPDRYQTRVKKALASVSKTAASARDFLDNPSKDKADAIAMDAFFGRGFTAYPNATKNLKFVRNVFDSISQGVTIYPTNPITKSTTRIACLTSQNSHPSFAQHPFVLAAVEGQALVVVMPRFWSEVKKGSIKACAPVSLTDTRAFYFLHEFAHLAGVGVNPRLPEVYDQEDTLRLNADQAIQNAQNYATAAHVFKFGCAKYLVEPGDDEDPPGLPHSGEFRKLLSDSDGFPIPKDTDVLNLTSVIFPPVNDTALFQKR